MRTIATILCILTAAVLAVCITFERQASARLNQQNTALRQPLSQMDMLLAESQRLSNLVANAKLSPQRPNQPSPSPTPADEPGGELLRLRAEVEALRQQSKEIDTLRADSREARAAAESAAKTKNANPLANSVSGGSADAARFEVLSADYWTQNTNMDVGDELRQRIRGDSLKAIASNNLKGDPDFGQVKNLTVVYRFGGTTFTNEFREGDFIVLPPQPEQ
jgi:hypothetical protein